MSRCDESYCCRITRLETGATLRGAAAVNTALAHFVFHFQLAYGVDYRALNI